MDFSCHFSEVLIFLYLKGIKAKLKATIPPEISKVSV